MTATRRAYLVALVDGGGTVPPELGVVRRLLDRGHDVSVLAEDSMAPEVQACGATFHGWTRAPNRPDRRPENDPVRDWELGNPLQLFDRLVEAQLVGPAASYAADVQEAIADRRPDVVVCSQFAFGAMIGAEAAGVGFVVLMPNIYVAPADGMPPQGLGLTPAKGAPGRLRDRAVGGLTRRVWDRKGLPRLNAVRAELGLAPLRHFWDQLHQARRELVLTSAAFDFPATLPAGARYVGPVLDDPAWAQPWAPPAGDDPLVLVAMSSTFQDQLGSLQRIADGLANLPVRGLITTGPALDHGTLRTAENLSVVASAPHTEVLAQAAAVVNHGGHGTVVKALAAGVPMVVMPHGRDQADNAARVAARGAGVTVKRTSKPSTIAAAVRAVLDDPAYRDNARLLGEAIRRDAAGDALLRELETLGLDHEGGTP